MEDEIDPEVGTPVTDGRLLSGWILDTPNGEIVDDSTIGSVEDDVDGTGAMSTVPDIKVAAWEVDELPENTNETDTGVVLGVISVIVLVTVGGERIEEVVGSMGSAVVLVCSKEIIDGSVISSRRWNMTLSMPYTSFP